VGARRVEVLLRRKFARLALGGTLLLGMTAVAPTVSAEDDPAWTPYCLNGIEIAAEPGQDLLVACGWGATTKGLMQMYINADLKSHTLTDASGHVVWSIGPEEGAAYWDTPTKGSASDAGLDCKGGSLWGATWRYIVPGLPAGTYTLTTDEVFKFPVNDGFHTCSYEGEPVSGTPSLYREGPPQSVVTIVVAVAP
jgi:hypothetical protein